MKTKRIPFNVELAKAGARIVTRCGYPVRIGFYDVKNKFYPILALVQDGEYELPYGFTKNGKFLSKENEDSSYDLFIEEEVKTRRMTYKELSWWLREHPEEHREYTHEDIRKGSSNVYSCYDYNTSYADEEVNEYIRIRKNGGEWQEPLIKD